MCSVLVCTTLETPEAFADGEVRASLAKCAVLQDPIPRLECYDRLATRLPVDRPVALPVTASGNWTVDSSVSPVDDSPTVVMKLPGNVPLYGWLEKKVIPVLIFRCKEGTIEAYVVTGMTGAGERTSVAIRFDKDEATSEAWHNSTDSNAMFLPGGERRAVEFIVRSSRHRVLLFQTTPYNSSPTHTTFHLSGVGSGLTALSRACPGRFTANQLAVANGEPPASIPEFGATCVTLTKALARKNGLPTLAGGAFVTDIAPGSLADKSDVKPGDLIMEINGKGIADAKGFTEAWNAAQDAGEVTVEIWRGMQARTLKY